MKVRWESERQVIGRIVEVAIMGPAKAVKAKQGSYSSRRAAVIAANKSNKRNGTVTMSYLR